MENLKSYKNYIARSSVFWNVCFLLISSAVAYASSIFVDLWIALVIGGLCGVAGVIIASRLVSGVAISATDFLARAILHVSSEQASTGAPDPKTLKADREFIERLASYVYDMSSRSVMSAYPKVPSLTEQNSKPASIPTTTNGSLLKLSPLPYFVVNKTKQITFVSQSAVSFLGVSEDKIIGKPIYDILKFSFSSDDTLENWLNFIQAKAVIGDRTWDRVKLTTPAETVKQVDIAVHFLKMTPPETN